MAINRVNLGNIKGLPGGQGDPGSAGRNGLEGRKINFRGAWVAGSSYSFNSDVVDVVSVGGDYYFCRKTNSRTASPALDEAFWGKMRGGSLRYIENFTLAVSDWEASGTAYVARKASGLPSGKFLQEIIGAEDKDAYGIFFDKIDGGNAVFYAKTLPAVAVTVALWYYDIDGTVVANIPREDEKATIVTIAVDEETGKTVAFQQYLYQRNGFVDWGDGTVDQEGYHTYQQYGEYTARLKGDIASQVIRQGFFGASDNRNYVVKGIIFQTDSLGESGLAYCEGLESVTFSGRETEIADGAFYACSQLRTVNLPSGIVEIGVNAFNGAGITSIVIPSTVTTIGSYAFNATNLVSVTIPSSVSVLPSYLFQSCVELKDVYLPHNITYIDSYVFSNTNYCTVHYDGTIAEWEAISKSDYWRGSPYAVSTISVLCTDGYAEQP